LKIALLDTETSGLDFHKDFIVSFSLRIINLPDFKEELDFYTLVRPNDITITDSNGNIKTIDGLSRIDFQSKAFEVNKIKKDDFSNSIGMNKLKGIIEEKLAGCSFVVAHNASFDRKMCLSQSNFGTDFNKKWICSLHDLPIESFFGMNNRKLSTYAEQLNIDSSKAHNASFDTYILLEVLKKIDNPVDFINKNSANKQFYITSFIDMNDLLPKHFFARIWLLL